MIKATKKERLPTPFLWRNFKRWRFNERRVSIAVKNFRDLMTDLETTDPSTDVQVSWGADPVYHFLNVDCQARDRAYKQPHIIPLKLAKWLGYKKLCEVCGNNIR